MFKIENVAYITRPVCYFKRTTSVHYRKVWSNKHKRWNSVFRCVSWKW